MPRVLTNYGTCCECHLSVLGSSQKSASKLYTAHKLCVQAAKANGTWVLRGDNTPVDTCAICLSTYTARNHTRAPCGHCFHRSCLTGWVNSGQPNSDTCPNCRESLHSPQGAAEPRGPPPPRHREIELEIEALQFAIQNLDPEDGVFYILLGDTLVPIPM